MPTCCAPSVALFVEGSASRQGVLLFAVKLFRRKSPPQHWLRAGRIEIERNGNAAYLESSGAEMSSSTFTRKSLNHGAGFPIAEAMSHSIKRTLRLALEEMRIFEQLISQFDSPVKRE
jgi:hypothetical protein